VTSTEVLPIELVPFTEEQLALVQMVRDFAAREVRPRAHAVDEAAAVPLDLWEKAAGVGIAAFMLPSEFGGGGVTDLFSQCLVQEELCTGDLSIGNLLTSAGFFASPLLALGSTEQCDRWLRPLSAPSPPLTAVAITEPQHGSDAAGLETVATRRDRGYVINGQKTWISNGGAADFYIVFATVDRSRGAKGITAFVFEKGQQGVRFGEPIPKMGQRAIPNCPIFFDDAWLPEDSRLGDEGAGFAGMMRTFEAARILVAAAATGVARAATEYAVSYARERRQFGKPIIEHQAVAFRLADMATKVEAARLLVWRAARRFDSGLDCSREASMAKLVASENATWVTHAAMQTLGGWSYSREYPVERWVRDARLEEIEEGTSDILRLIIARRLRAGS
jgi:alkylation response protein AidB-like acyl-CoA dehydrogenase